LILERKRETRFLENEIPLNLRPTVKEEIDARGKKGMKGAQREERNLEEKT